MALNELLNRIRREQPEYSPIQKRVAAYVLENYKQIPFYSITTLSEEIGVSHYSVIIFCKNLGYHKFSEFKKELSRYAADLIIYNKLSQPDNPDTTGNSNHCFDQTLSEDIQAIQGTLSNPSNRENLPRIVEMLNKAQYIYVLGGRSSSYFAGVFANFLRYLDLKVVDLSTDRGDFLDRISMITPNDLVVAISFPRYTMQIIKGLSLMHERNIPVVLITDTEASPAQPYASLTFYCQVDSSAYVQCYSGCLSLINSICRATSSSRKLHAAEHVHALEEHFYEQGIFSRKQL